MSTEQQANPFERELTGVLKNARVMNCGSGRYVAYGNVYQDSQDRFPDGTTIRTSVIVDTKGDHVLTRSGSVYRLDTRH